MDFEYVNGIIEEFFNGQYEVKKFLGEGAFSQVYLVKHKFLDELRAMKIIKEPIREDEDTKTVFHEVQLATQLRHSNIISIYDAGIISTGNLAYFVMEYVPGGDLEKYAKSFINSNIQVPVNVVLNLFKQIAEGLNVLHSSDPPIVHRDLKLNNILLNYNAEGDIEIKISDFGFAKEVTKKISDIDIVGTRPYMAPECFKKSVSTMTDIYAVGVIIYRLLTGKYPYDVDKFNTYDLMELKAWKNKLILPSQYRKDIPSELEDIVVKCLEVNPQMRYLNACELLSDVEVLTGQFNEIHKINQISDYSDDYSDFPVNDNLIRAFELAKSENGFSEAIEILENEVLKDYTIRQLYGETLRMWKSPRADVKLISKAFTVNLKAKNYSLSISLLREAITRSSVNRKYLPYIELWEIFIRLSNDMNLIKAVLDLEELMDECELIYDVYSGIIDTLKTYSVDEIIFKSLESVKNNNLADAGNLMEFAVICDSDARKKYEYRLSLWKQNMEVYYKNHSFADNAIDFAIDLGTVDSLISYYNDGNPVIIKNHQTGDDITPSAVLIDNDKVTVGSDAIKAIGEENKIAFSEFKYDMGFSIPFSGNSSEFLPEELSSIVLKDLRTSAYKQCGVNAEHAVVCVPSNSNPLNTKAIMDACELAGFRSYNLIFEPIAVAIAYNLNKPGGKWLIYDLGGSTFDLTLLEDTGKRIEKIDSVSLENFGGKLFDWKIVEKLFVPKIIYDLHFTDFLRENSKYNKVFSRLKNAAEEAKIQLSDLDEVEINLKNLFEGYDFNYNLKCDEFREIIRPLIRDSFEVAGNLTNGVCEMILVGGSCLSPVVKELIFNEFDIPVRSDINPLAAVSLGAAVYAGKLKKPEVLSYSGPVSVILNRNGSRVCGRLFSMDKKLSFLGYSVEFSDKKTGFTGRIPADIDGVFDVLLPSGEYEINVFDKDNQVELDVKSPSKISDEGFFIPFFSKYFDFAQYDFDLNGYYRLCEFFDDDDFRYLSRLVEISEYGSNLSGIYLNHFFGIFEDYMKNLEFSNLLDNVCNKLDIFGEDADLDLIVENRDLNSLKSVYYDLVEKYVRSNKNKVICDCFYNLMYMSDCDELIEKGLDALANEDYRNLLDVVNQLFEFNMRFDYE